MPFRFFKFCISLVIFIRFLEDYNNVWATDYVLQFMFYTATTIFIHFIHGIKLYFCAIIPILNSIFFPCLFFILVMPFCFSILNFLCNILLDYCRTIIMSEPRITSFNSCFTTPWRDNSFWPSIYKPQN